MNKDNINHLINDSVITKEYDKDRRIRPRHTAFRITVIYIVIGSLWILLSDRILSILVQNEENISKKEKRNIKSVEINKKMKEENVLEEKNHLHPKKR